MSAVTNKRIFPDGTLGIIDKMRSKHFAGNGRIVTACGEPRPLPSDEEWTYTRYRDKGALMLKAHKFASNRCDPRCKKCQRVLAAVKDLDVYALVATGEYDKPDAMACANFQVKAAKAMLKRLGPGWTARVWENIGYHWEVSFGTLALYPSGDSAGYGAAPRAAKSYHVIFNGRWCASDKKPEKCIKVAVQAAREEVAPLHELVFDRRLSYWLNEWRAVR